MPSEANTAVDPIAKVSEIAIVNFWFTIFTPFSLDPKNKLAMLVIGMIERRSVMASEPEHVDLLAVKYR